MWINTFDLGNNNVPFPHQALIIKQLNMLFALGSAQRHHLSVPSKIVINCWFIKKEHCGVKGLVRFRRSNDRVRIEQRSWARVELNT